MEGKKTITSIFIVPTVGISREQREKNNYLNGYIKDKIKDMEYGEDSVFLLFRPKDIDKFREFLDEEYARTKSIIDDYDHKGGFVVVVYKLDGRWQHDFKLVRQGKYSKTSLSFQSQFPKTITIDRGRVKSEQLSLQYRIFNKAEDLVKFWEDKFDVQFDTEQELWEGFDEENESLTEEKLKEYGQ